MEEKDFNIKGGVFSLRWDSEDQILFIEFWGKQNKKTAEEFGKAEEMFFNKFPVKSLKIFVNAMEIIEVAPEARRTFSETLKKYPVSVKMAVLSNNTLFKIIAGFITAVGMGRIKVKFFEDKKEALKWLKEN